LSDTKVIKDEGEKVEKPRLKKTDKVFINQDTVESTIDFTDTLELNKDIKDKLGLLSYRFTKEEFLDLS
jgi:hypothetical protein